MADQRSDDLAQARNEAALLLRLDPGNLSPSDVLRCDLVASLRLVVDDASATVLDGRAPDLARLLTATETLIRLLPSEPPKPAANHPDPRVEMFRIYSEMRRRGEIDLKPLSADEAKINRLESENAQLRAALGGSSAIDPAEEHRGIRHPSAADITPPSELGEFYRGQRPGPDDPKPPVTIEGKAVPPAPAASVAPASRPQNWDDTPGGKAWRAWRDAGGSVGGGDRWSNRNE